MFGVRKTIHAAFPFLLIASVVFLMPGPGLASLAIPDNEQDAAVSISDSVHASKRLLGDSWQKITDIVQTVSLSKRPHAEFIDLIEQSPTSPELRISQSNNIRGPPAVYVQSSLT